MIRLNFARQSLLLQSVLLSGLIKIDSALVERSLSVGTVSKGSLDFYYREGEFGEFAPGLLCSVLQVSSSLLSLCT